MGLVVFSLLLLCGAAFADLAGYKNKQQLDSNYMVYWTHNATSGMMNIALEVKKTGWVAFGFTDAKSSSMKDYDVCIGYVDGNNTSLKDYLTNGHTIPPEDTTNNNCMLDEAMESGGTTTLKYHRKVDTGDSQDRVIKAGEIIVVWGYRNTEKMLSKGKHDEKGFAMVTMISSDDSTMTTKPTSGASTKLRGFYWNISVTSLFVATALILK